MTFLYAPYYCEENIWHLCQHAQFAGFDRRVVFISNAQRSCPFWFQKAARNADAPVLWDYHVILLYFDAGWKVWDLDTVLANPIVLPEYLSQTFHGLRAVDAPAWFPVFKLISADLFLKEFTSDRSHMKDESGHWSQPPPDWPLILGGSTNNLQMYIDMNDTHSGTVMRLDELRSPQLSL